MDRLWKLHRAGENEAVVFYGSPSKEGFYGKYQQAIY
jgi:hypothetical protein